MGSNKAIDIGSICGGGQLKTFSSSSFCQPLQLTFFFLFLNIERIGRSLRCDVRQTVGGKEDTISNVLSVSEICVVQCRQTHQLQLEYHDSGIV